MIQCLYNKERYGEILKKLLLLILTLVLISACAPEEEATESVAPEVPAPSAEVSETENPEESSQPSEEPEIELTPEEIYAEYLSENPDNVFTDYAIGVGIEDFDFDGVPEMYILDSGAGSSAFAYFFDIDSEGNVVSIPGDPTSTVPYLCINSAEDFSLLELENGNFMFTASSRNGETYYAYLDTVVFETNGDGILQIRSYAYVAEEYSVETGETISERFLVGGTGASAEEYDAAMNELFATAIVHDYQGTFARIETIDGENTSEKMLDCLTQSFEIYNSNNE